MVRVGGSRSLADFPAELVHRVPGRTCGAHRADRRVGAGPIAGGALEWCRIRAALVLPRRRVGGAPVAAYAVRAPRGQHRCARRPRSRANAQSGGEGVGVPRRSECQRARLDWVLHSGLRHPRSGDPLSRLRSWIAVVHRWRPRRALLRSDVRPLRERSGSDRGAVGDARARISCRIPAPALGATGVHRPAVRADRDPLRHVVGRLQFAGAVPRAASSVAGYSDRRRVGVSPRAKCPDRVRGWTRGDGRPVNAAGDCRSGTARVFRSGQRVRAVDGVGEPDGGSLPRASIVFRARAASAAGRPLLRRSCRLAVRHRIGSPRCPRGRAPWAGPIARQSGNVCRVPRWRSP